MPRAELSQMVATALTGNSRSRQDVARWLESLRSDVDSRHARRAKGRGMQPAVAKLYAKVLHARLNDGIDGAGSAVETVSCHDTPWCRFHAARGATGYKAGKSLVVAEIPTNGYFRPAAKSSELPCPAIFNLHEESEASYEPLQAYLTC